MKASEVTLPGFYWYGDGTEWRVVEFFTRFGGAVFYFAGSDISEDAATIGDGEFVGPLPAPGSAPDMLDAETVQAMEFWLDKHGAGVAPVHAGELYELLRVYRLTVGL